MLATTIESLPTRTLGLDVGDRWISTCLIDQQGNVVAEGRVRTDPQPLGNHLRGIEAARVVLEVGQHSRWICEIGKECGHEVIVANPETLKGLVRGRKTDRLDAAMLARLGRLDPNLLRPVHHRARSVQADRAVIKARDATVRARTDLFNATRGLLKSFGVRPPSSTIPAFPKVVGRVIPADLQAALAPLLNLQLLLTRLIQDYDKKVETLCQERYPETQRLRQIKGVGPLTSLHYVLTLEDPARFRRSRTVGAYIGLCPKRSQSGEHDPELRITKTGDADLRRLLVQASQYILGPFGKDCDLRRYGLRIAERGRKNAKKRAVIAVARKLAVLLHRLWVSGETYEPLRASEAPPSPTAA
jgi:transposase